METAKIKMRTLEAAAQYRPDGYLEACLAAPARICGAWVIIPAIRYAALRKAYGKKRPSLAQKVAGFLRSVRDFQRAGYRMANWRTFLARNAACRKCPLSRGFLIKTCGRCGCSKAKLWLASSRCLELRWPC